MKVTATDTVLQSLVCFAPTFALLRCSCFDVRSGREHRGGLLTEGISAMAHPFRKQITRYVGPDGKRCLKDAPNAKRVDEKSSKWYGRFRSPDIIVREVALFKDKTASRQRLAELERKAEQSESGLLDPFEESRKKPLVDHVTAFRQHLESKGNSEQHVALTVARCEARSPVAASSCSDNSTRTRWPTGW